MKKIKQKNIEKNKTKEKLQNSVPVEEEKIDYIKYIALQVVLGTIALIAMMVIMYLIQKDTTSVFLLVIAYFPYIYIKRESPKSLHILAWSIYIFILIFGLFFR